jgi:hypothetical protein
METITPNKLPHTDTQTYRHTCSMIEQTARTSKKSGLLKEPNQKIL